MMAADIATTGCATAGHDEGRGQRSVGSAPTIAGVPADRPMRILLVEDEAVVAMDLGDQIEEMGYRVCGTADSAAAARAAARELQPDVVLMDIVLKGPQDGIDIAAEIGVAGLAPVVFLTAFSDPATVRRAAEAAPYGYLTKPFDAAEVRAAIEVAAHRFAADQAQRARLAAFEPLRRSEERFRSAFDFAPLGMALMSLELQFLQTNPAMCQLLGRPAAELAQCHRDGVTQAQDREIEDQQLARLLGGQAAVVEFEKRFVDAEGQPVWTLVSVSLLQRTGLPPCYVYQVYDLRRRKEVERRLSTLARTDPLTGLANRRFWREEADRCIAEARHSGRTVGVLFLDLDNFKQVNDALGHGAGDQLLKLVAQRLRRLVRARDVVARYGGDEFLVLLTDLNSRSDVAIVAHKLVEAVRREFPLEAGRAAVGLSVGAAVYPYDGRDTSSLLEAADNALYGAKARGRNRVQFSARPDAAPVPPTA